MDLYLSVAVLSLVLIGCVRWLRPLLILPWGVALLVGCFWARSGLWVRFGGDYYELTHAMFPEEIPGTTSPGFEVVWGLTLFGFLVLFLFGARLLVRSARGPKPVI
jgi:hypothetical protein